MSEDSALKTHLSIDTSLSGKVIRLSENYAEVWFHSSVLMQADNRGLIHGGFLFSAADYAAMAAVNDPLVVLAAAEVRFLAPAARGESVLFRACVDGKKNKKYKVSVEGFSKDIKIFKGVFTAVVPAVHVLDSRARV